MEDTSIGALEDILELIDRITHQTQGLSREEFLAEMDVQDATAFRILAIGEASKNLTDEMKSRHPPHSVATDFGHA